VYALTGFRPANVQLYHLAFLHSSLSAETNLSNERLEYLGDAVLSLVIADYLFLKFPYKDEGYLTDLRSKMVSRSQLNVLAMKMGIEEMLQYNKQDSFLSKKSISGNALEALIGAVYLDYGYEGAKKFILRKLVAPFLDVAEVEASEFNYKSKLLEWAQKNSVKAEFKVVEEKRNARFSFYKVDLLVDGNVAGTGEDNSKKNAEKKAAKEAFGKLGIKEEEFG
jgi:ribonuclease-3